MKPSLSKVRPLRAPSVAKVEERFAAGDTVMVTDGDAMGRVGVIVRRFGQGPVFPEHWLVTLDDAGGHERPICAAFLLKVER